jgi:hypothetical protein
MMEAARSSETVNFYQTTRHYNPEDGHLHFIDVWWIMKSISLNREVIWFKLRRKGVCDNMVECIKKCTMMPNFCEMQKKRSDRSC